MQVHPRIRQRIRQNWIAKEAEIQSSQARAVDKLNGVLDYLRGGEIYSRAIDIDALIAEVEEVRSKFISFRIDAENPLSIHDSIAPHIDRILDKLNQLEREQEIDSVV